MRLGNTIDPRLLSRGFTEEQIAQLKDKIRKGAIKECISLNVRFKRPLEEYKYPYFGYVLTLFNKYSEGVLPYPGALANQPAQIIEIFNTLESLDVEFKQKEMEKQQAQNRKQSSGRR